MLVDAEAYPLKAADKEKQFKFNLKASLAKSRSEGGVFAGLSFYMAAKHADFAAMIKANGGALLAREPKGAAGGDGGVYVVAVTDNDKKKKTAGTVPLVAIEFIMTGILRQTLPSGKDHQGAAFVISGGAGASGGGRASRR